MKKITLILFVSILFSCNSKSELYKELNCKSTPFSNLESIEDVKKLFTVQFPDNWKTNLYYDKSQSSIYTADTTKQLTETMLLDITHVSNTLRLNTDFIKKFKQNLVNQKLVETVSGERTFKNKEAYYSNAFGKKNGFDYQIMNLFIKINEKNYLHSKIEVYGDSLVNQRICNGLSLLEKTKY